MRLILASSSPYRRDLLQRLQLPFEQMNPTFTEGCPSSMPADEVVRHNTMGKANSVLSHEPDAVVIASDQVAVCGSSILGKPGSIEKACAQLAMLSGQSVLFLTGLTVLSASSERFEIIPIRVFFRQLSKTDIETYVHMEPALDCAGSFKSEGLGISLFERLEGEDSTALIGLPMVRLSQWLNPLALLSTKVPQK